MKTKIILIITIITVFFNTATAQNNTVVQININKLISRVTNKSNIGLDSLYNAYISKSSPYYGDFYGLQVIQKVPRKDIRKDFKVISETDSTISIKLGNEIFNIFDSRYPIIAGITVPYTYLIYEGNTYKEFLKQKEYFYKWLSENNLSDKYLIKNDFYEEELYVERCWNKKAVKVINDTLLHEAENCIHIYMDRVHGDSTAFEDFLSFVDKNNFDWIGIEMMDIEMQETIDKYIFSNENTIQYKSSRSKLFEYYSSGWIKHFKQEYSSFEENPFCRLMTLLRQKRIKVYAIEESNEMFLLFRNGETQFGGAVRSAMWTKHLPAEGRGLIFGGSAHFTNTRGINFQDFYHKRAPKQEIIIIHNQ